MESLRGKVAIVTGASSGIGEGIAIHFAKLGVKLVLAGRSSENLQRVAELCTEQGSKVDEILIVPGDINKEEDRKTLIEKAMEKFPSLDILVNNAGVIHYTRISAVTPGQYDDLMNTNIRSHVFLTQLALPAIIKSKGTIINVSSICGPKAMPEIGVYCMSKAAMDSFTECLALEMAPHGVRVNSINPGTIVSNIARREHGIYKDDDLYEKFLVRQAAGHPLGRVGVPQDCAETVAFLASDGASFITGQTIFIDGGRHCVASGVATNIKK